MCNVTTRVCPLCPGGFKRSTQHYPLERSGRGAGAISPLRAKILDAALVPRSFRRCQPFIGRSFSALKALPSAAARTMSVHVPSHACHSNVPEQSGRVLRRPVESTPRKRTADIVACPLCANSGQVRCSKNSGLFDHLVGVTKEQQRESQVDSLLSHFRKGASISPGVLAFAGTRRAPWSHATTAP